MGSKKKINRLAWGSISVPNLCDTSLTYNDRFVDTRYMSLLTGVEEVTLACEPSPWQIRKNVLCPVTGTRSL